MDKQLSSSKTFLCCYLLCNVVLMPIVNGERIKRERVERGLGLQEFARLCGVDAGNLSRIERGLSGARMVTLRRIAAGLKVPLTEIAAFS